MSLKEPTIIYQLCLFDGVYKIGITKNLGIRLEQIRSHCKNAYVIEAIPLSTRYKAQTAEAKLKSMYKDRLCNMESAVLPNTEMYNMRITKKDFMEALND